jgi:exosortase A
VITDNMENKMVSSSSRWPMAAMTLFAALLVMGYFYFATALSLTTVWTESSDFSHGWLIVPISAWLIWMKRVVWMSSEPEPSSWGIALVLIFGFAWLLGDIARVSVVRQLGLLGFLPSLVLLVFGVRFARTNLFALGFLFFGVPAGEALNPILMKYTADATIWALQKTGVPVFREGLNFVMPTGSWSVVDACSGLRYLISAIVLGSLFGYLNYSGLLKKCLFVLICAVLSVVANWARAYSVVMVGHLSNMRFGTGDDHVWYGWVFFGVLMTLIFWMGAKYGDKGVQEVPAIPSKVSPNSLQRQNGFGLKSVAIIALGFLATAVWTFLPATMQNFSVRSNFDGKLIQDLGWAPAAQFPIKPGFPGAISSTSLSSPGGSNGFVSYFAKQTENTEMFAFGNRLIPENQTFVRVVSDSNQAALGLVLGGLVKEQIIVVADQHWVVWHWFLVGEQGAANPYVAKALRAIEILRGRGDHSAVLVLAKRGKESNAELRESMLGDALTLHRTSREVLRRD